MEKDKSYETIVLKNDQGIEVEILTLGGIIKKIKTPDKDGNYENILLEFKDDKTYWENPGYINASIGRTAGRIHKAQLTIDGKLYKLSKNDGVNNLHGGDSGFNKKIWQAKDISTDQTSGVRLTSKSSHMEEGYPGNLLVSIDYILTNTNELHINYKAQTDKDTVINLTNHGYFNLSGNAKRNILDHKLQINSSRVCKLKEGAIPTGQFLDLDLEENSAFDFRKAKKVGKDISKNHKQLELVGGYDHPWVLDEKGLAAKLYDKESARTLEVYSDQNVLVVYSANGNIDADFTNGESSIKNYGITFESQNYPIGVDECFRDENIVKAGQTYSQNTIWKFGVK